MRTLEIKRGNKWFVLATLRTSEQIKQRLGELQAIPRMHDSEFRSVTTVGNDHPTAIRYFPSVELLEKRIAERETKRQPAKTSRTVTIQP